MFVFYISSIEMPCKHVFDDEKKCTKSALYNLTGLKPEFCKAHKTDDMVDVFSVRCDFVSESGDCCKKTVSWGYPDKKKKIRCAEHKLDGMKDLKHPSCEEPDCPNSRSYGFLNDKCATHCSEHKKEGMINVKHKKCESCRQIPSYNYDCEKTARFCKEHRLERMVDVTHRKCEFEGCNYRPLYNVVTETKPRFCVYHKTHEMVDVANKKCLSDWCYNRCYSPIYDGYCVRCYVHLFPEKPITRNYKTKEKTVSDYILEVFPNIGWISDKRIQNGTSRRRPDLFLDLGYQIIIVEIDENQHIDYDCSCENKRLMEISKDVEHRNIIFLRFNPDQYVDKNKTKIKSCWSVSKSSGLSIINKTAKNDWEMRLNCLKMQIQYWIENKTDKLIEIVQLFYDEC